MRTPLAIFLLILLTTGCSTQMENLQKSSDARFLREKKYVDKISESNCIEDYWELWLEDLIINQSIEGNFEKTFGNELNELAVVVNIFERTPGTDSTTVLAKDRTLLYTEGVLKNVSPNEEDALIYAGKYSGKDIIIELKVIEYDDKANDDINNAIEAFKETLSSNNISTIQNNQQLNTFASFVLNRFTRNDLFINHKITLHACNSFKNSKQERFFTDGIITIIRYPNGNASEKWPQGEKIDKGLLSYIKLRIVERTLPQS